jgi:uncharacterized protein YbbK (DUF523 family)
MSQKIKIGISACLLGNNVRYDGGNKPTNDDRPIVIWVPFLEVESGLPVPREAMQLVVDGPRICLITIETKHDRLRFLPAGEEKLKRLEREGVSGFVLGPALRAAASMTRSFFNRRASTAGAQTVCKP